MEYNGITPRTDLCKNSCKVPSCTADRSDEQMHHLLHEFKSLYVNKLKHLDDLERGGKDVSKTRSKVMQSYVKDLNEQNDVLLSTLDEIEQENDNCVSCLESKLYKATSSAEDLQRQLREREDVVTCHGEENKDLNYDIERLISVINIALCTGEWKIDDIHFRKLNLRRVFGPLYETHVKTCSIVSSQTQDLHLQLRQQEKKIAELQNELSVLQQSQSACQEERFQSDQISNYDQYSVLKSEIRCRDKTIQSLRQDILRLQAKRDTAVTESDQQSRMAKVAEDQLCVLTEKARRIEDKYKTQALELAHLRALLDQADNEVRNNREKVMLLEFELGKCSAKCNERQSSVGKDGVHFVDAAVQQNSVTIQQIDGVVSRVERSDVSSDVQHQGFIEQLKEDLRLSKTQIQMVQWRLDESLRESKQLHKHFAVQVDEIERLQSMLHGQELLAQKQAQLHSADITDREEEISRLKSDVKILQEGISSNDAVLRCRDEDLSKLQGKLDAVQDDLRRKVTALHSMHVDLISTEESCKRVEDQLWKQGIGKQRLEQDMLAVQDKYSNVVEQNVRLEARIQAIEMNAQSDNDSFKSELRSRDDVIKQYDTECAELKETISCGEEKISQLQCEVDKRQNKINYSQVELESERSTVKDVKSSCDEMKRQLELQSQEMSSQERQVQGVMLELQSRNSMIDKLHSDSAKKDKVCHQLEGDLDRLHCKQGELFTQVQLRDETIQKLNFEIISTKTEYQKKLHEIEKQMEQITKCQETITRLEVDLDESGRQRKEDVSHFEETIKQLQEDFLESQAQHSTCYNEAMQMDEEMDNVKEENSMLAELNGQTTRDVNRLQDQLRRSEFDLTISQEKHCTCQKEVSNRDHVILRLEDELQTLQQHYSGCVDDLTVRETEIQNLTAQNGELRREVQTKIQHLVSRDVELANSRKRIEAMLHQQEMITDEIKEYQQQVKQLNFDLIISKTNHGKDVNSLQSDVTDLRHKLNVTRKEVADVESEHVDANNAISRLNTDLDRFRKLQEESSATIAVQCVSLKDQERQLSECRQECCSLAKDLDIAREETERLQAGISMYKYKHNEHSNQIHHLEATASSVRQELQVSLAKNLELMKSIEELCSQTEALTLAKEDLQTHSRKCEDAVCKISQELAVERDNLSACVTKLKDSCYKVASLEQRLQSSLAESLKNDERARGFESKLLTYQANHSHSNEVFQSKEEQVHHLEHDLATGHSNTERNLQSISQLEVVLSDVKAELEHARNEKAVVQLDMSHLAQRVQRLQYDLATAQEMHKAERSHLEDEVVKVQSEREQLRTDIHVLKGEVDQKSEHIQKLEADNVFLSDDLQNKVNEVDKLEGEQHDLLKDIDMLQMSKNDADIALSDMLTECNELHGDLSVARQQCNDCAKKMAHHEEKLVLMEHSFEATQDQLTQQITKVVQVEQNNCKLKMELQILREYTGNQEKELQEQTELLKATRDQLVTVKGEHSFAQSHVKDLERRADNCSKELSDSQKQECLMTHQMEQQNQALIRLQAELQSEHCHFDDVHKQLQASKKAYSALEQDVASYQQQLSALAGKVTLRDDSLGQQHAEIDRLIQSNVNVKKEVAEKERHIGRLNQDMHACRNQLHQQSLEMRKHADIISSLHVDLDDIQGVYRKKQSELMIQEQFVHQLKLQLSSMQTRRKEDREQLSEKSYHLASNKSELSRMQQQNVLMSKQIYIYEDKFDKQRCEMQELDKLQKMTEEKLQQYEEKYTGLQADLMSSQEKQNEALSELEDKEEEMFVMKMELSTLKEKLNVTVEDLNKVTSEKDLLEERAQSNNVQIEGLRTALVESKAFGEKIQHESQLVVRNINIWVQEQKMANEVLGKKIREQSKAIVELTGKKEKLLARLEMAQNQNSTLRLEMNDMQQGRKTHYH